MMVVVWWWWRRRQPILKESPPEQSQLPFTAGCNKYKLIELILYEEISMEFSPNVPEQPKRLKRTLNGRSKIYQRLM